ncbi:MULTISPECIES: TetR/AcrR family transcriptional regulator [Pseudomonas]|uniref:TetR/AcrR family transcriptional regulator n=1 Tax=Pseudomonas sp. WC2401 TaxID=3234143 RepID=A0AB39WYK0_9PSED|nr:TetR family transcriptional regulator [Pseudomonas fragi]NNB05299.1 TetR family transcriptional regulator [Pseudomonas fragi]WRT61897.1 TetR family transcriptional regulator [Pseudomonas fragi]
MSLVRSSQGAANVAVALAQSVEYQGRKASRHGSEQRRQLILDAAMRIVIRDGVRGVRHRAVAAEAGVPLSATTYYFKDIDDLINDTFAQYVEHSAAFMAKLWQGTEGKLREMMAQGDGSAQARAVLADDIARMTAAYLQHQMLTRRDQLMAEQAFHQAALINPRLAVLVRAHQQIFLQGAGQIFEVLGSTQPQQDAKVLTAIIGRMEYQALLDGAQPEADDDRLAILTRYMHLVLAAL